MKSLEFGIVKKYHKIYVSIETNKQNLSQDVRAKWNEHENLLKTERIEFFYWHSYTRVRTQHTIVTIYRTLYGVGPSICGNEIIFYLPINWFGCLFHYILFIYVVCASVQFCVSFENNKSTIELNTKKKQIQEHKW